MLKDNNYILGVGIDNLNKEEVLEKVKKGYQNQKSLTHIVTINPEFLSIAQKNQKFKKVLNKAQIAIPDGVGIILAGKILGKPFKEKISGIDIVKELVKWASKKRLTVGFIGGKNKIALKAAKCLQKKYPNFNFFANLGAKDVKNETDKEKRQIISIVSTHKPQILFVAYGAPWQDLWIDENKKHLGNVIAVGVGGAFDEIAGLIRPAPKWMKEMGLKWFWRLINQPWRWKRQLRLLEFAFLVMLQKFFPEKFKN